MTRRAAGRDGRAPAGGQAERSGPWACAAPPEGPATAGIRGRGWGRSGLRRTARLPPPVPGEGRPPSTGGEPGRRRTGQEHGGGRGCGGAEGSGTAGPLASSLGERLQGRLGACDRTGVRVGGAGLARRESGIPSGGTRLSPKRGPPWEGRWGVCIDKCGGSRKDAGEGKVEDWAPGRSGEGGSGEAEGLVIRSWKAGSAAGMWGTLTDAKRRGARGSSVERHPRGQDFNWTKGVWNTGPQRLWERDAGEVPRGRSWKAGPEGGAWGLQGAGPRGMLFRRGLGRGPRGSAHRPAPPLRGASVSARLP